MSTTPVTLLQRLREGNAPQAWQRFVDLYTPLLYRFARKRGVPEAEAADLVQDVFVVLVAKLPEFVYDPGKSFRRWLSTILMNKWRDRQRAEAVRPVAIGDRLPEPLAEDDPAELLGEEEYQQHLVARALELMQGEFEPATWKACWEHGVCGRPAAEVAAELGISPNAVYLSTSRVLRRLRAELHGLLG